MSCNTDEEVRVIIKYSTIGGSEPTIPTSGDHEDGTWLPTDLYTGELFMNSADNKLWIRTDNGIIEIGGTAGGTSSFIGDYVHIAGGTYSGDIYAPTFSSDNIITFNVKGDVFQGYSTTASFIGNFSGDGSGLTGLICEWLGGTVSNPVHFTNRVDLTNEVYIDGAIYSNNPNIVFNSSLEVMNGVSASIFYGDGSGLTNLPTGTYSDTYTIGATLSGNQILFGRNDGGDYMVDLTPILATQGVAMVQWDDTLDTLSLIMNDSSELGIVIDTFSNLNSLGTITAPEFYGGTFYGTFVGDMEGVIGATGAAGATGAPGVAGPTGPAGPSGANLNEVLVAGNETSGEDIIITAQDRIYFSTDDYITTLPDDTGMLMRSSHNIDNVGSIRVEDWLLDLYTTSATETTGITVEPSGLTVNTSNGTGLKYMDDYSATLVERSLVDKGYVDGILNNMTLESALKSGNTTGTQSIYIGSSASIIEGYNGIRHHWYDASNPILGDYYRIENGTGSSSSYIQIEDNTRGNIRIANDNLFSTSSDYSERTSVIVGQGDIQHNATVRDYVGGTVWGSTNQTIYMNGSDIVTRDYILDTTAWIATYTAGAETYVYFQANQNGGASNSTVKITQDTITSMVENGITDYSKIDQTATGILIEGFGGAFRGFEYAADYSATFTSRSLVDKSYIDNTFSAIEILYSDLVILQASSNLIKDATYFITDRKIWLKALETNLLSPSGQIKQTIINNDAYNTIGTLGVWTSALTPSIGDKTIWNCKLWSNTTGINTQPDFEEDWILITTDALYYDKIFDIEYDFLIDSINVQSDDRGNILRRSMFSDLICDWGNNYIFGNECSGIYNNTNAYIMGNKITGGIFNNNTTNGVQNNAGNINIHSNTCQAITYNQSSVYGNNIPGNISNNECEAIYNNNGPTNIQYNNNNGSIYNNTTTGDISYNTNTSDIHGNSNTGSINNNSNTGPIENNSNINISNNSNSATNGAGIVSNSNTGDIVYNSNGGYISLNTNLVGVIEQNSNNGNITANTITGSIFKNSNNGDINNNSTTGWIRYNSNLGDISFNTNSSDIENNMNNGNISSNDNAAIGYNLNNGAIILNSNTSYINNNSNNGVISSNTNSGIIQLNSNDGGIFNNSNAGNILQNSNGSDIGYNSISGFIQNNTNSGSIQNNTQTSGTTNITYNNNNGNISGARTGNITGTIVNI